MYLSFCHTNIRSVSIHSESVTASVFILSGQELKATIKLDGPVAPLEADTGNALQIAIDEWEKAESSRVPKLATDPNAEGGEAAAPAQDYVAIEEVVDFEHLNIKDQFEDEETDDELLKINHKELSASERKRIKDKQRKKILVKRQKQEQQRLHQHRKVREEGQPFQTTVKVPKSGWYRFCVVGSHHQVRFCLSFVGMH